MCGSRSKVIETWSSPVALLQAGEERALPSSPLQMAGKGGDKTPARLRLSVVRQKAPEVQESA